LFFPPLIASYAFGVADGPTLLLENPWEWGDDLMQKCFIMDRCMHTHFFVANLLLPLCMILLRTIMWTALVHDPAGSNSTLYDCQLGL